MNKEAILVVNTKSRNGDSKIFEAIELLNANNIKIVAIHAVFSNKTMQTAITEIRASTCNLVIIASGDGTISSLVDHLAFTEKIIAILPFGTTNNFARTLEIPLTVKDAVEVVATGKVVPMDLGKVNEDYFANVCTIGLSGAIANDVPHALKRYFGRVAYVLTGLYTFLTHKPFTFHIKSQDFEETLTTHQIVVANGRFHAGVLIEPDAKIDNKQFIIFTLGGLSKWEFVKSNIAYLFGKHKEMQSVFYKQSSDFTITLNKKYSLEIDGEARKVMQAHFSIAPNALQVIVPKDYNGQS